VGGKTDRGGANGLGATMASEAKIAANRRNWAKCGPLTDAGRERLRLAALRDRPWEGSTGPRTPDGMARTRMNALRHGRETAAKRAWRRDALRFIKLDLQWRMGAVGPPASDGAVALAAELVRLADRLCAGTEQD